jgi:LysR family glycine cleavage system transcriptional activator
VIRDEAITGRRLPPLNALRIFEAVGRHLSMSGAARDLHMTQGAVSQQVRSLESYLGVALFLRGSRALALTAAGQSLFSSVSPALAAISMATRATRRKACSKVVALSTVASLASWWLLPRVSALETAVPGVLLRIEVSRISVRFESEDMDLAIRYGVGPWPGLVSRRLFQLRVAAVVAKGQGPRKRQRAEDWIGNGEARILVDPLHDHWSTWSAHHGVDRSRIDSRLLMVDDMNVLLGAARAGQGVALVPLFLVLQDLREGKLEVLDREVLQIAGGYWLVQPTGEGRKVVVDVSTWIEEQAQATEHELSALLATLGVAPSSVSATVRLCGAAGTRESSRASGA